MIFLILIAFDIDETLSQGQERDNKIESLINIFSAKKLDFFVFSSEFYFSSLSRFL